MIDPVPAIRGRFAPSPTGLIHLGNVWTALLAWLHARQQGGAFVLRIEDLDPDRSRAHYTAHMLADLRWLGLDWDEGPDLGGPYAPYVQDQRRALYAAALARLDAQALVYRCYCTRAEVRAAASAPHVVMPREQCANQCWALTSAQRSAREAAGRRPCVRVRVPQEPTPIAFRDLCRGAVCDDLAQLAGDFVVQRADGVHAYQLAVVVDDAAMRISHVVRGGDLLDSTARQLWLHRMLGSSPPSWAHVPLLIDREGQRLSKRHGALAIAQLRAAGKRPSEIIGWLAHWAGLIRTPAEVQPRDLIGRLDLSRLAQPHMVIDPTSLL